MTDQRRGTATAPDGPDADERARRPASDPVGAVPGWAFAAAGLVLLAVALEVVAGSWANSRVPAWVDALTPLSWPPWARGIWWLLVTAAVGVFHLGMARAGQRRHPVVIAATVLPFLAFAVGAATSAEWAIFH